MRRGWCSTPSFELGARLDGGDAETGLGVDLGGGLSFAAPRQGVALDPQGPRAARPRGVGVPRVGRERLAHLGPAPGHRPGALAEAAPVLGRLADGRHGLAALPRDAGRARRRRQWRRYASAGRLEAELGFGLPLFDGGFTGTPNLGIGFSETGRDYRLGWRLTSARKGDPGFTIGLDATRREAANADAGHGLMLRGTVRW